MNPWVCMNEERSITNERAMNQLAMNDARNALALAEQVK